MVNDNSYAYQSKDFSNYSCKQLKRLLNRSSTVTSIGIIILIGAIFQLIVAIGYERIVLFDRYTRSRLEDLSFILIVTGVIAIVTAIGILNRRSWGRWAGLFFCIIYLIGFPFGTAIGIVGIPAFFLAKELFGYNRIHHASIKEERKRRKEAGVLMKGDSLFSRLLAKLAGIN